MHNCCYLLSTKINNSFQCWVIAKFVFWQCIRWFAKRFMHPDIIAQYNYVFLWDEDLGVEHFHADKWDYSKPEICVYLKYKFWAVFPSLMVVKLIPEYLFQVFGGYGGRRSWDFSACIGSCFRWHSSCTYSTAIFGKSSQVRTLPVLTVLIALDPCQLPCPSTCAVFLWP